MPLFRRKLDALAPFEATQYLDVNELPPGVHLDGYGRTWVRTMQGRDVDVSLGEWVIAEPDGEHYYPCADELFQQRYELVPEDA